MSLTRLTNDRLQAQRHSLADPLEVPKYRSAPHALFTIIKEEGFLALYKGVGLTALRQGKDHYYRDYAHGILTQPFP